MALRETAPRRHLAGPAHGYANQPGQALAWVLRQPLNIFALVGCNSGAEFQQNVAAAEVPLSREERDWLDLRRDDRGGAGAG